MSVSKPAALSGGSPGRNQTDISGLTPPLSLPRPTNDDIAKRLEQIDELKYFLATATNDWDHDTPVKSLPLPTGESISCVFWNNLFHITGTDIVRSLIFRFHAFGRPVCSMKKFEEGIFSDLRNLKPGSDACLEEPKSDFLEMLYKNNCIRTQKKQKVFYWFSVPHDRLFLDALERDLKREKMGVEPTSIAVAEPASLLSLDSTHELFDQLRKSMAVSAAATAHVLEEDIRASLVPSTSMAGSINDAVAQIIHSDHVESSLWRTTRPLRGHLALASGELTQRQSRVSAFPVNRGQPAQLRHRTSCATPRPDRQHGLTHHWPSPDDSSQPTVSTGVESPMSHGSALLSRAASTQGPGVSSELDEQACVSVSDTAVPQGDAHAIPDTSSLVEGSPGYKKKRRRATSLTEPHTPFLEQPANPESSSRHPPQHTRSMSHPSYTSTGPESYIHTQSKHVTLSASSYNALASATSTLERLGNVTTARIYTCPLGSCRRLFKRLEHLRRHLRTHTLERPFVCDLCGKHFARSDNLAQHRKIHDKAKPTSSLLEADKDDPDNASGSGTRHRSSRSSRRPSGNHTNHHHRTDRDRCPLQNTATPTARHCPLVSDGVGANHASDSMDLPVNEHDNHGNASWNSMLPSTFTPAKLWVTAPLPKAQHTTSISEAIVSARFTPPSLPSSDAPFWNRRQGALDYEVSSVTRSRMNSSEDDYSSSCSTPVLRGYPQPTFALEYEDPFAIDMHYSPIMFYPSFEMNAANACQQSLYSSHSEYTPSLGPLEVSFNPHDAFQLDCNEIFTVPLTDDTIVYSTQQPSSCTTSNH